MNISISCKVFVAICVSVSLSGCGIRVPTIEEVWDDGGPLPLEKAIKRRVYCELSQAVKNLYPAKRDDIETFDEPDDVMKANFIDFGVQVALNLTIDETTSVNPGLSLITPMHSATTNFAGEFLASPQSLAAGTSYGLLATPQNYTLGLGGTLSSHATRIDKFNFYYNIYNIYLNQDTERTQISCDENATERGSSLLLYSDLGIPKWIENALELQRIEHGYKLKPKRKGFNGLAEGQLAADGSSPLGEGTASEQVLTYEVKFDIVSTGTATPSWKLVRVASNQSATQSLFSTNRERTHDLTITFSPQVDMTDKNNPKVLKYVWQPKAHGLIIGRGGESSVMASGQPIDAAIAAQQASQIGLAVANALKSQ